MNYPKHRYTGPRPWMDKQWLENEYVIKDRSTREIAEEYGCKPNTIQCWLVKHGIKKEFVPQHKKRDYLYEQYITKNKTAGEIAKSNHTTIGEIENLLIEYGIDLKDPVPKKLKFDDDAEKIISLYCDDKMSANQIGKMYGTEHTTIIRLLKKHGIKTRDLSEAQFNYKGVDVDDLFYDANKLDVLHNGFNLSCVDLGERINVSPGTVRRQMQRLGIHTKNNSESKVGLLVGDRHPNWQGGKTSLYDLLREYYNVNIAPKIKERDNYTCQECGATDVELHTHHIKRFCDIVREICGENSDLDPNNPLDKQALYFLIIQDPRFLDENNIITLCKECHINQHRRKTISSQAQ